MNKKTQRYTNVLNEVNEMLNHVKTLNEAMSFDTDYDIEKDFDGEYSPETDEFDAEPNMDDVETTSVEDKFGKEEMTDIDRIREIALKGMLKYVKQSNSAEYETLKKIFQFCDKVNNDKSSDSVEEK